MVRVVTGGGTVATVPLVATAAAVDGKGEVLLAGDQYVAWIRGGTCYAVVGVPVTAAVAAIGDVDVGSDLVIADATRTYVLLRRPR